MQAGLAFDAGAARFTDSFSSWRDAFEEIPRLDLSGRKLVVIDEFPYAAEGNDALPSILRGVWDEVLIKNTPTGPSALAELRAKEEAHFPRGEGWLWLFSKSGFTDDGRWAADDPRVRLVDPEELGL